MSLTVICIIISVVDIFNIGLSFLGLNIAEKKGQNPLSAFIAVMLFSFIGLAAVSITKDKTSEVNQDNNKNLCIIFFSENENKFQMMINGTLVESGSESSIFSRNDLIYRLRESDGKLTYLTKEHAINYINKR